MYNPPNFKKCTWSLETYIDLFEFKNQYFRRIPQKAVISKFVSYRLFPNKVIVLVKACSI